MVGALFKREDQSFARHSWLMMPHGASPFWRRRRSGRLILAAKAQGLAGVFFPLSGKPPTYVYVPRYEVVRKRRQSHGWSCRRWTCIGKEAK